MSPINARSLGLIGSNFHDIFLYGLHLTMSSNQEFGEIESIASRYKRAEELLPWNLSRSIRNAKITPFWIAKSKFIYKHSTEKGHEYIVVDCEEKTKKIAFNHVGLAKALTAYSDIPIDPYALPLKGFKSSEIGVLSFELELAGYQFNVAIDASGNAQIIDHINLTQAIKNKSKVSPDGQWAITQHKGNLSLVRANEKICNSASKPLTFNGSPKNSYGCYRCFENFLDKNSAEPIVSWSLDSKYIAVQRVDVAPLTDMSIFQFSPSNISDKQKIIPVSYGYKFAGPGDEHVPISTTYIIQIETGKQVIVNREPAPLLSSLEIELLVWSEDSRLYQLEFSRGQRSVRLVSADRESGESHTIIEEFSDSYVNTGPSIEAPPLIRILPEHNEFIWYSESQGVGQLYLFDLTTGELKNPITGAGHIVTCIHYVDTLNRLIYFSASHKDQAGNPYYQFIYRIGFDGSQKILLTPEDCFHDCPSPVSAFFRGLFSQQSDLKGFSPNGKVFIDIMGGMEKSSEIVLRRSDNGARIMNICTSENTAEVLAPISICVKAADNKTDLWGAIYRPSDFNESCNYPVILSIYGTAQFSFCPKFKDEISTYVGGTHWALAELGFIVVVLDPRGTPLRSRAFQNFSYGNLDNGGGLEDQVYALEQLADKYSWIDLDRTAIVGISGGGFAAARGIMTYPELFKVAVSICGNHDQRLFLYSWAETYHGKSKDIDYAILSNSNLAGRLTGKLLLVHGDMDAQVHPSNTMQLVDALIKEHKDFDLLLLPNQGHFLLENPYLISRTWNYLVENLLGDKPPEHYQIPMGVAKTASPAPKKILELMDNYYE